MQENPQRRRGAGLESAPGSALRTLFRRLDHLLQPRFRAGGFVAVDDVALAGAIEALGRELVIRFRLLGVPLLKRLAHFAQLAAESGLDRSIAVASSYILAKSFLGA